MKIIKTANGNQIEMSKEEWLGIGKQAGFIDPNVSPEDNKAMQACERAERLRDEAIKEQQSYFANGDKVAGHNLSSKIEQITQDRIRSYTSLSPLGKQQYNAWKKNYNTPLTELNSRLSPNTENKNI